MSKPAIVYFPVKGEVSLRGVLAPSYAPPQLPQWPAAAAAAAAQPPLGCLPSPPSRLRRG